MKVVVDQDIPYLKGVLEPHAEVQYLRGRAIGAADVRDADALIVRTRTRCDAPLLQGSRVRLIASATIGFDHIDTAFCAANGITWTNAPGCNSSSVRQYVAAALLHVAERRELTLAGMTIGIVGVGNVGSKVADLCRALGMTVLLNDPPRERREGKDAFVSLAEIVKRADIVTFHVPLQSDGVDRTLHLVNRDLLAAFRPQQMLINTSRGEVIDGAALKAALLEKRLAACVLDVWEHEPGLDLDVMRLVNIATPHIAGYSADGKANGTAMSVQALSRHFGLGLDTWYPADVPPPVNALVAAGTTGLTTQQVIASVVHTTYDIAADDVRLRSDPSSFERQRTEHPFRREFHNYAIVPSALPAEAARILLALGFQAAGPSAAPHPQ